MNGSCRVPIRWREFASPAVSLSVVNILKLNESLADGLIRLFFTFSSLWFPYFTVHFFLEYVCLESCDGFEIMWVWCGQKISLNYRGSKKSQKSMQCHHISHFATLKTAVTFPVFSVINSWISFFAVNSLLQSFPLFLRKITGEFTSHLLSTVSIALVKVI